MFILLLYVTFVRCLFAVYYFTGVIWHVIFWFPKVVAFFVMSHVFVCFFKFVVVLMR